MVRLIPFSAQLLRNLGLRLLFRTCSLVLFLIQGTIACGQTDTLSVPGGSRMPAGQWLESRTALDKRPIDDALLGDGLLGPAYFTRKSRRWIDKGLSFDGYLSSNGQGGSNTRALHGVGEFLFIATWEPLRRNNAAGRLVVGFAHDRTFGRPTTKAFASDQGNVETPNDLDTDPSLTYATLGLLYWEQEFRTGRDQGLGYRVGQLYVPSFFCLTTYLDDDRRYLMARPLATAGGAQWFGANDIGLGLNMVAWKGPFYVSAAATDGTANKNYPDLVSLFSGQFLYLGEVGIELDRNGANAFTMRLTGTHLDIQDGSDPSQGQGRSMIASAMKTFKARWAIAGRWSKSFDRLSSDYRELGSLGFFSLHPFGRASDLFAVGLFAGVPSDPLRGAETGAEVSYRLQLTQAMNVMPDLQYWTRKDGEAGREDGWIVGVRMNFEY